MTSIERLALGLRVGLEVGIVVALAYWGVHTGASTTSRVVLGVAAPIAVFGFWGAVDFHQAGRFGEPLRLIQELAVSGLTAVALYATGLRALAFGLAALSVVYHALVYISGGRLLKRQRRADHVGATTPRAERQNPVKSGRLG